MCRKRSAFCAPTALVSTLGGSSEALQLLARSNRGSLFLSISVICPTTNLSTNHSIEMTMMRMGLLSVKWYSGCCFTWRVSLSVCLIFNLPWWIFLRNPYGWFVRRIFTEFFSHHGVPAFQFGLCVSLLGHWLSVCFIFSQHLRSRRNKPSLHKGFLDQRIFFEHTFDNDLTTRPKALVQEMTHVDVLFGFVRRQGFNNTRTSFNRQRAILSCSSGSPPSVLPHLQHIAAILACLVHQAHRR